MSNLARIFYVRRRTEKSAEASWMDDFFEYLLSKRHIKVCVITFIFPFLNLL